MKLPLRLPAGWKAPPLGILAKTLVPQRDKPEDLTGPVPWVRIEDFDGPEISRSKTGQGVSSETIAKMNLRVMPVGTVVCTCSCSMGTTAIVTEPLVTNQTFIGLVPDPARLSSRYLYYALAAFKPHLDAEATGAIQQYLSRDDFRRLRLPLPPLSQQRTIADYLDAETARIDAVIERRRVQRTAVRDRLTSEVERRVLGALGLTRRGSQASSFFISRPVEWNETTLRHVGIEVQTGPFGSQLHAEEYVDDGTPVINPMHLVSGKIMPSVNMAVSEDKKRALSRHLLRCGDVIVARRGELGRVAVVDEASMGYLCGTGCLRLRPMRSLLRPGYLSMLLASAPLRAYFDMAAVGSTMDNLSAETLLAAPVLVPPLTEQEEIEFKVEAVMRRTEAVARLLLLQVDLLLERRQALITAAVTGQLEIPGVAA